MLGNKQARFRVPDLHRPVITTGNDVLSIWRESDRADAISEIWRRSSNKVTRFDVPNADCSSEEPEATYSSFGENAIE
jgi:hypothetical protein